MFLLASPTRNASSLPSHTHTYTQYIEIYHMISYIYIHATYVKSIITTTKRKYYLVSNRQKTRRPGRWAYTATQPRILHDLYARKSRPGRLRLLETLDEEARSSSQYKCFPLKNKKGGEEGVFLLASPTRVHNIHTYIYIYIIIFCPVYSIPSNSHLLARVNNTWKESVYSWHS